MLLLNKINLFATFEGTLGTFVADDLLKIVGTGSGNINPKGWARAVALPI